MPFTVFVIREGGFNGAIDLKADNIPKGVIVKGLKINAGISRTTVTITAPEDAEIGKLDFTINGVVKMANGTIIKRTALPVESMLQAFYYTHLIPTQEFRTEIIEPQPFSIVVDMGEEPIKLTLNEPTKIKVILNRKPGYTEPITKISKLKYVPVIITELTKGTSKRILGQAKNTFIASVIANSPIFQIEVPSRSNSKSGKSKKPKTKK